MSELSTDITCGNCGRTVTEVNIHEDLATCVFCDLNREGPDA